MFNLSTINPGMIIAHLNLGEIGFLQRSRDIDKFEIDISIPAIVLPGYQRYVEGSCLILLPIVPGLFSFYSAFL
jgi:hypothetical protein